MPGNRRQRQQQHRGQQPRRQRRYRSGGQDETYKPGFPMNLFTGRVALIAFVVVGVVAMAGGITLSVFQRDPQPDLDATPEPAVATEAADGTATAEATPNPRVFAAAELVTDARAETYAATIATAKGDIVIELYADVAPNTVNSFVFLAEQGYFDGITFHRVVDNFVVQGGDPEGTGVGGPGYQVADEPNELRNETGTVAMAKAGGQTVFGSQFFINLNDNPALDFDAGNPDAFYPFGRVIEGMDVVRAIVVDDVMESVTIERTPLPDDPSGDGEDAGEAGPDAGDGSAPEDETDAGEAAPTPRFSAAGIVTDAAAETYVATIATAKGDIVIELYADVAPNTVNSFVFLAEQGYFDGITFHRVVDNFVVQGGDPEGTGVGGPGYQVADEPNELRNETGTVAMAKAGGQTVFGSQFFINLNDNPALDFDAGNPDAFYPFGRVIEGMDVVRAIVVGDVMEAVTIERTPLPDDPSGDGGN